MTNFSRADVAALLPTLFLPFNLAKGGMNMAATLLLYPPVVGALRRAGVVPPSQSGQGKTLNAGFCCLPWRCWPPLWPSRWCWPGSFELE